MDHEYLMVSLKIKTQSSIFFMQKCQSPDFDPVIWDFMANGDYYIGSDPWRTMICILKMSFIIVPWYKSASMCENEIKTSRKKKIKQDW